MSDELNKNMNINWFPGHMKKAVDEIVKRVKIVDVIIELLDARAPISSRNMHLYKMSENKKRLIVVTKSDLADLDTTKSVLKTFESNDVKIILLNLNDPKAPQIISQEVFALGKAKREKESRKGMLPQPIRAMIVGIPNVGKSTLINKLSKRSAASVQNKPGHTRAQQWIKVNKDFELLDTPGVLPPRIDDKIASLHLALIGSIKETILPIEDVTNYLYSFLAKFYKEVTVSRYGQSNTVSELLTNIANKRGYLNKGMPDINKASLTFLKEFKEGLFGGVTLDRVN